MNILFVYLFKTIHQLSELICNKASIVVSLFPLFVSNIDFMTSTSNVGNISAISFMSASDIVWVLAGVFETICSFFFTNFKL